MTRTWTAAQAEALIAGFLAGERRCLARLLSLAEDEPEAASALLPRLMRPAADSHPPPTPTVGPGAGRSGDAPFESGDAAARATESMPMLAGTTVVGLTGAPGCGKSSVAAALVGVLRQRQQRVAVLAIDPSSPFSGGALLGDRLRMRQHDLDEGVFIRSMASRGQLGGLSAAAWQAVGLFERFGFEWVLVETVGVGQSEVDIARLADVTVVVLAPGMGDDVQAMKAGIMEIADLLLINKADREGAARTRAEVEAHVAHSALPPVERPPVLDSVATSGLGIEEAVKESEVRATLLSGLGQRARRREARLRHELRSVVGGLLERALDSYLAGAGQPLWQDLLAGRIDARSGARCALAGLGVPLAPTMTDP